MKKVTHFLKKYWLTFLLIFGVICLYIYISENGLINAMMFPPIDSVWSMFADNLDVMGLNFAASIKLLVPSIVVTIVIALSVGIFLGLSKYFRNAFYPLIYAFSCVPSILLSPFVTLIAPTFMIASVILIVYDIVFSLIFATITGIESIDKGYLDNAKTLELSGLKLMTKVVLPAASPAILGGFVNSLRSSFVMLVFAEMYGAKFGMGYYVKKYSTYGLYQNVWAGFLFMVVVLVVIMQIFEHVKKRILKWTV